MKAGFGAEQPAICKAGVGCGEEADTMLGFQYCGSVNSSACINALLRTVSARSDIFDEDEWSSNCQNGL